jgi:uncharacterized protein DUF4340
VRLRNPLIALGILAGLSAYVYLVEIKGGEKKQKEKEAGEHLLQVKTGDVTGMTLSRSGERVRLEKVAGHWRIQEPLPADADADAVDRTVQALEELRILHDLGKQADEAPYGLKTAGTRVEARAGGRKLPAISLGAEAPTGGGNYARRDDSAKILVVSGASPLESATFLSLRDKSFLKFDPSRLSALRLVRGKEEVALARIGGKWRLAGPVAAPADDAGVADLAGALERLSVSEFVEEHPAPSSLAPRGLDPPEVRVVLSGEEWKGEKELRFGKSEGGSLYTLHPSTGALVRVPDTAAAKLKLTAAELRKKEVLPLSRWEISRLRISGLGAAPLDLRRKDDREWTRASPAPGTLSDESVDLLLRDLSDLKADSFEDRPGASLERYGLLRPQAILEFWQKDDEKSPPAVIEVGATAVKEKIAMRDKAWAPVLLLPAEQWGRVRAQALKVAEEKPKPEPSTASSGKPAPPAKPPAKR